MKKVWDKVERMIRENWQHRSGFKLGEVELPFILTHAQDELDELWAAPDDEQEMADLLATLIHYCIKQGWTMAFMQATIIDKLNMRFKKVTA